MRRIGFYIHQRPDWPAFTWDPAALEALLGTVRHQQGRLLGRLDALGVDLRAEATLRTLTLDVLKSSEIEGELLPPASVRSSIAWRLGLEQAALPPADRRVEGVVAMLLDATQQAAESLTAERLFGWHAALFPTGYSGLYPLQVGAWRTGPMQVVSGPLGRERVHYDAPAAEDVDAQMAQFLDWFNADQGLDPVLKAGLAHFWFVTIHPFDDGNGRIARAIADLQLTRADGSGQRCYSMSAQIQAERQAYYDLLESSQRGPLDVTPWLTWFLECLGRALQAAEQTLAQVLAKARFWERHRPTRVHRPAAAAARAPARRLRGQVHHGQVGPYGALLAGHGRARHCRLSGQRRLGARRRRRTQHQLPLGAGTRNPLSPCRQDNRERAHHRLTAPVVRDVKPAFRPLNAHSAAKQLAHNRLTALRKRYSKKGRLVLEAKN